MKSFLTGAATGCAISYAMFGDPFFAVLTFAFAVSALAFIIEEEKPWRRSSLPRRK